MAEKVRLGVVGIGNIWHGAHAAPLLKHPDVEIVGVCDIVREKAAKFAAEHSIKHVFTDWEEMLDSLKLDAVDICTPNLLHSKIAVGALKRGLHAFTEKPDAVTVAEAEAMAAAAAANGKTLMAMRNNRFAPPHQWLKRYADAGHLGEVYAGRCGWIRRRGIPGKGGWFTTKALSGGGPLIDLGVHLIDLTIWLMGNPRPTQVMGSTYRKFAEGELSDSAHAQFGEKKAGGTFDVEDLAMGFIRFDNGATLQIEFSWASNIERESVFSELRGTKAGFKLDAAAQELKVFTEVEGALCDLSPRVHEKTGMSGHGRHLYHFIDVVRGLAKPINTPEDGVHMIKILTAIYRSADTGKVVDL